MELDKVLNLRRSCRHYTKKEVPRELLSKLMEAAFLSPSSCNLQVTRFIVIDDKYLIDKLGREVSYKFSYSPACILVLYDSRFTIERDSVVSSSAMASENILLKAVELGLGTCPMAGFSKDEKIKEILQIPKHIKILLLISVGFSDMSFKPMLPFRLSIKDIFNWNGYGEMGFLLDSNNLSNHSVSSIVEYRKRISTVYLDRFRLNTFSEKFYKKACEFLLDFLKKRKVKKILDVMTYDGVFIKNLFSCDKDRFDITASDYLENNLKFFNKIFGIKTSIIDKKNNFSSKENYDLATFVFQAEFTPDLKRLVRNISNLLDDKGILFIANVSESCYRRFGRHMKNIYRKFVLRKTSNIYEGNVFYKIGPKKHLSDFYIKKLMKQNYFSIVKKEKIRVGFGINLVFYVFSKSSLSNKQNR